jgi:uncharacterized protein
MLDLFYEALNFNGLFWVLSAAFLAGIIRGFSGFGTAMVYLPLAAQVLPPVQAIVSMVLFDLIGIWPTVPRALKYAKLPDVFRLGLGMVLTTPLGLLALYFMSQSSFRLLASVLIMLLLLLLIMGVRYRGALSNRIMLMAGALGGLFGGSSGLCGPPVIMVYMASKSAPEIVRANLLLYLIITDIVLFVLCFSSFDISLFPIFIGFFAAVPFMVGNIFGSKMFDPKREGVFRIVAYVVIGFSAIYGLPIWNF